MLFLTALRDLLKDENQKIFVDNRYLKNPNANEDTEHKIKLKQVETDWTAYKNLVLNLELSESEKKSAVYTNYLYFKKELQNRQSKYPEYPLTAYVEGLSRFSVITIQLEPDTNPWESPQEIFESMNSLGKPLSLADLVRNYLLLGYSPKEQDDLYHNYWMVIERNLRDQISNFIRDYMQYKAQKTYKQATEGNYKQLYRDFKDLVKGKDKKEILSDFRLYAPYYASIILATDTGDAKINKELEKIRTVKASTCYSFLLGIIDFWKKGELSNGDTLRILQQLNTYLLRRRILGLTGPENKEIPKWAAFIPALVEADDKTAFFYKQITTLEYNMRLPNDTEIQNFMSSMNFYAFAHSKNLLCLIEEYFSKDKPNPKDSNLSLEHIMPQTLTEAWQNELGENFEKIHLELINNIGNITLIRHNSELSNKPFNEKKVIYQNNVGMVVSNKFITDQEIWDENAIRARAKEIVDIILNKILPIPSEYQEHNNYFMSSPGKKLSFEGLKLIGKTIQFAGDESITALVVSDKEVLYNGENYSLSGLTKKLKQENGTATPSEAYQGSQYWKFKGKRISSMY